MEIGHADQMGDCGSTVSKERIQSAGKNAGRNDHKIEIQKKEFRRVNARRNGLKVMLSNEGLIQPG